MKKIYLPLIVTASLFAIAASGQQVQPSSAGKSVVPGFKNSTQGGYSGAGPQKSGPQADEGKLFHQEKIEELVEEARKKKGPTGSPSWALDDQTYGSLSLREQFTYHMIHREYWNQGCSTLPWHTDPKERIYFQLEGRNALYQWSERQWKFFGDHRGIVIGEMESYFRAGHEVSNDFKQVIVLIGAREMIPMLVDSYQRTAGTGRNGMGKDHYILTTLILLMSQGKYQPFISSAIYKQLSEQGRDFSAFIPFNPANESYILNTADKYYRDTSAK